MIKQKFFIRTQVVFSKKGTNKRCYLGDSGGVGKSMFMNAIENFFETNYSYRLGVGAFSGNAADNIESD